MKTHKTVRVSFQTILFSLIWLDHSFGIDLMMEYWILHTIITIAALIMYKKARYIWETIWERKESLPMYV